MGKYFKLFIILVVAVFGLIVPNFTFATPGSQISTVSNCKDTGKGTVTITQDGILKTLDYYFLMNDNVYREIGYYCNGTTTLIKKMGSLSSVDTTAPTVKIKKTFVTEKPFYSGKIKFVNIEAMAMDSQTAIKSTTIYFKDNNKPNAGWSVSQTNHTYNLDARLSFGQGIGLMYSNGGEYQMYATATDVFGNVGQTPIMTITVQ